MRRVFTALLVLLTGAVSALPPGPEPEPVLIERSVTDNLPREMVLPVAWTAAALGAGSAAALASWALVTAPSPGSFGAFAWATAALALAAAALEVVFTVPPDPPAPN